MNLTNGFSLTAGSFNHYGTLTLGDNSTLTVNGTFLEYGTLNVSANNVVINAGQMQIISGGVPTSNGSLSLIATAPTSTPNLTINGALIAAGPMTIGDGGTAAWMHVNGTLEIQGPAPPTVINLTSQLSYNGTAAAEIFNLTLNQGIFTTTAGANLSGTLLCTGANGGLFQGNLQNAGGTITFSGGSVSGLLVTGNFSQFLGTLQFRVMGINVADGLLVLGNTTVSGTLEVSDPFTSRIPVVSSYVIIRASTLTLSSPTIALPDSTWIWFQFLQDLVVT